MASQKITASVVQAYLATKSPDEEINLVSLATELREQNLQQAVTFFSTLTESVKVKYLVFLYNYYYYALTDGSYIEGYDPIGYDNEFIHEVEDDFIIPYSLDTTQIVPLRKLISRLQKEVAKQRQHRKEEDVTPIVFEEDHEHN